MVMMSNKHDDITITKKMADGGSITMKSPVGNQMDLGLLGGAIPGNSPTPVSDDVPILANAGEYIINVPAAKKYKGLLQRINQEGREMLKQGGWIDDVKPMGYNQGGMLKANQGIEVSSPWAGYANYGQQDFLNEADKFNNPGAQLPSELMKPEWFDRKYGPYLWNQLDDNGKQEMIKAGNPDAPFDPNLRSAPDPLAQPAMPDEGMTGLNPPVMMDEEPDMDTSLIDEGIATNESISQTTGEDIEMEVIDAGGDPELAEEANKIVGPAKGVDSYLANLNKQIDSQQNKRKKARLLAFGLALLGGESMSTALRAAEQTPFFDEEDLDQMLAQRKDLMDGVHTEYLASQGIWTPAVQKMQEGQLINAKNAAAVAKANLEGSGINWDLSKLTEAQSKNVSLGNEAITGAAELKALEDNAPADFNPRGVAEQFNAALVRDGDGNITGLNDAILNKMDPYLAAYLRSTMKVITAKLRKESGAAISASEWSSEMTKILPAGSKEFKSKQEYRDRIITTLVNGSGAPNRNAFYKATGFESDYNANEWFEGLFGPTNKTPTGIIPSGGTPTSVKDILKGR